MLIPLVIIIFRYHLSFLEILHLVAIWNFEFLFIYTQLVMHLSRGHETTNATGSTRSSGRVVLEGDFVKCMVKALIMSKLSH